MFCNADIKWLCGKYYYNTIDAVTYLYANILSPKKQKEVIFFNTFMTEAVMIYDNGLRHERVNLSQVGKVFKNGTSKACRRQPLKNVQGYCLLQLYKVCLPQILLGPFLNTLSQLCFLVI